MRHTGEKGFALVVSLLVFLLLGLMGGVALMTSNREAEASGVQRGKSAAFQVAEGGLAHARTVLEEDGRTLTDILRGPDEEGGTADDGFLPEVNPGHLPRPLGRGTYTVRVIDNDDGDGDPLADHDSHVLLVGTGVVGREVRTIEMGLVRYGLGEPPAIRGVITANNDVGINGDLVVDGRDHDLQGNVLPGQGTLAVSTTHEFFQGGDAFVGGTDERDIDHPPTRPGSPLVIEEFADWSDYGGYPTTPDRFMGGDAGGYPEGTLKALAMSRSHGSQYVTDPADLRFPLRGVTYVELRPGQEWEAIDFKMSRGILVVHNEERNAVIKNLNTGQFEGLIIADDIVHVHNDILGAIAVLTPAPSEGNVIGNGRGRIRYSSEAIERAIRGAGLGKFLVRSWREVRVAEGTPES